MNNQISSKEILEQMKSLDIEMENIHVEENIQNVIGIISIIVSIILAIYITVQVSKKNEKYKKENIIVSIILNGFVVMFFRAIGNAFLSVTAWNMNIEPPADYEIKRQMLRLISFVIPIIVQIIAIFIIKVKNRRKENEPCQE